MIYSELETILQVENISLILENKQILRDISFEIKDITRPEIKQGQVVSLIGRSGMGKTQLFKILAGLQKPNTGTVHIGQDLHPVKAGDVGIVPQNYILFNHRTIYENLAIGLNNSGKSYNNVEQKEIIYNFCDQFDLSDHLKKFPLQLSGGQRQRVSLLQQALAGNMFILLDEPFSGLDMIMVDKVIELLIKISHLDDLNTLIIVSHDIVNSIAISDTVFILSKEPDKPGATLSHTFDLKKMDLAWDPEIKKRKEFTDFIQEVKLLI
jgi:ABC-type nitrate/sulfonate/bicarbonate transport system ATPase subunit